MASKVYLANDIPSALVPVREAFSRAANELAADEMRKVPQVRALVRSHLQRSGWLVAEGSRRESGIPIARSTSGFVRADAAQPDQRAALWIETGRSWLNNGFLEHLVEAIPCPDIVHLAIAVRTIYNGAAAFEKIVEFLDPVVASDRIDLPFRSLLLVGY